MSGLLRQLQQGEVDISVAPYSATYYRQVAFDFLRPMIDTKFYLYIKNPDTDFNWMAFVSPLSGQTWLGLLLLALFVPFLLTASAHLPPKVSSEMATLDLGDNRLFSMFRISTRKS